MTSTGREGCAPMTPDLIARLREEAERQRNERGDMLYRGEADPWLTEAADRLEALRSHAEAMAKALKRAADIVERNLYRQHEKIEDVPKLADPVLAAYRSAFPEMG